MEARSTSTRAGERGSVRSAEFGGGSFPRVRGFGHLVPNLAQGEKSVRMLICTGQSGARCTGRRNFAGNGFI